MSMSPDTGRPSTVRSISTPSGPLRTPRGLTPGTPRQRTLQHHGGGLPDDELVDAPAQAGLSLPRRAVALNAPLGGEDGGAEVRGLAAPTRRPAEHVQRIARREFRASPARDPPVASASTPWRVRTPSSRRGVGPSASQTCRLQLLGSAAASRPGSRWPSDRRTAAAVDRRELSQSRHAPGNRSASRRGASPGAGRPQPPFPVKMLLAVASQAAGANVDG